MNRHNGAWSAAREEQLREMWRPTGPSCSEIARAINRDGGQILTKCAIIDKARRLGLAGRAPVPPPKRRARKPRPIHLASRPGTHPAPQPGIGPTSHQDRSAAGGATMTQPSPPMRPEPDPLVCTTPLLDLATHGCRWPDREGTLETPYLFCGVISVEGSSYCRCHHAMSVGGPLRFMTAERRSALACLVRAQRSNQSNATKMKMVGEPPTIEEL